MPSSGHPMRRGAVYGLAAEALFGASAPLAKLLLNDAGPLVVAGLLYLGAGLGLAVAGPLVGRFRSPAEASPRRGDVPVLLGLTVSGGIAGPILMLVGLSRVSGVTGSLLLNLEGPMWAAWAAPSWTIASAWTWSSRRWRSWIWRGVRGGEVRVVMLGSGLCAVAVAGSDGSARHVRKK